MKIVKNALKTLIKEAIDGNKIVKERPWSVEYVFNLSGGTAEDSEGEASDGFSIITSGKQARITVDTYWNPQSGDESGNQLKIEGDVENVSTYVPTRFDDGESQCLVISNASVSGLIAPCPIHTTRRRRCT